MLHITPEARFQEIFEKLQQKQDVPKGNVVFSQIQGLSSFHRATHIEQDGEICAFSCYIPNYLISSVKCKETKKVLKSILKQVDFPIEQDKTHLYSECILVPYIASLQQHLKQILYLASAQAIFKQIPLVIPKSATQYKLDEIFTNIISYATYYVVFPFYISQFITNEPSQAGPFLTKSNIILHPVQIDNEEEYKMASLILQSAFQNDPVFSVYQSNVNKRKEFTRNLSTHVAKTSRQQGTNFLFCPIYKSAQISNAVTCVLSSPPGQTKQQWGGFMGTAILYVKQLGINAIHLQKCFDILHKKCCGNMNNHYYGAMLGTTQLGMGFGQIANIISLDICDQTGAYFYVENSNESNMKLYQSLGLKVYGKYLIKHKGNNINCWGMRRDPQENKEEINIFMIE
ncbi:Conserved_hypothetical protein [Hexamita inflata]|uniref:N-acetyltransferase domain-containing protein n=1 Tax=Hexamita inflata TaxID=28002 RepID=A0AA86NJR6_9EUKA|nr:Conserved hypothetical protein [Hexamita inflata]